MKTLRVPKPTRFELDYSGATSVDLFVDTFRLRPECGERLLIESVSLVSSATLDEVGIKWREDRSAGDPELRTYLLRKVESVTDAWIDGDGIRGYLLPAVENLTVLLRLVSSGAFQGTAYVQFRVVEVSPDDNR